MRHVRKEFALGSIRQLSGLPCSSVFLDRFPEVVHHLIDLETNVKQDHGYRTRRHLTLVFNESISPDASTVMNLVKSPSVAAAEICAKART